MIFNLSWLRGICLIYAVIMKIPIKPQIEHNLYRIERALPLACLQLNLMVAEISEGCSFNWKLGVLVHFLISQKWLETKQPRGYFLEGEIFSKELYFLGKGEFSGEDKPAPKHLLLWILLIVFSSMFIFGLWNLEIFLDYDSRICVNLLHWII